MKNIFTKEVTDEVISRIEKLTATSQPSWGEMSIGQMLAHCSVTYEMVYTEKHKKPNAFTRFILRMFVKSIVVSEKPYSRNGKTAPQFIMKEDKNFGDEKKRLVNFILKTQELGESYFDGKVSHSFGKLTAKEWNNSFYKHLDHHLNQFGV